jgi:cytochrome c553
MLPLCACAAEQVSLAPGIRLAPVPIVTRGDPVAGKAKSDDERCQECHGHDGNANDSGDGIGNVGKFPKLAGQHSEYIVKQIRNFRSGARNNETMFIMARSVSDADVADIAAYFSSQKKMSGANGRANTLGEALFVNGDNARNISPCTGCHGANGEGAAANGVVFPVIGGQHRRYLLKQLTEWKAGVRTNSPGGVMNKIAKTLSDAEIEALAEFVSGL